MLKIKSQIHDYSVFFESSLEVSLRAAVEKNKPYFLIDKTVYSLYKDTFKFLGPDPKIYFLEATEENKSYKNVEPIFHWLLENKFRKDCCLIVVGGGITQDVGCFITTVLFRGSQWKLLPTTLLAQSDSCIGSKSSINIGPYKNQIGSFYPPHSVHISHDVLSTLTNDEIFSGVGEMIKLALLDSEAAYMKARSQIGSLSTDRSNLPEMVRDALLIKKSFIEEDEFDRGIRNILNYGHTFGHGFEAATHYKIPHGIAVSLGMLAATYFSMKLGMVSEAHFRELSTTLLPICRDFVPTLMDTKPNLIIDLMKHDKKNVGDKVTCILTRGFGRMEKVQVEIESTLSPLLGGFFENGLLG